MKDPLRYRYQTLEIGNIDIHIRSLWDAQEFYDKGDVALKNNIDMAQWSLFGVIWPSSLVLAEVMRTKEIDNLDILEVGCGLAVSSILLSLRGANIKATDYHPSVSSFLKENIRINKCPPIPFFQADWLVHDVIPESKKFDIIIGSDILYQRDHPTHLSNFINQYARKKCQVIITDPGRGNQNNFKKVMQANGFSHSLDERTFFDECRKKFKGQVHQYKR